MKVLNDRYATVMNHRGLNICTLKSACPAAGDNLGYKIDHIFFSGCDYNHPEDAVKAINDAIKNKVL